ncbi:MAG: FtsW/RodA/SpoVE family cell cycle protein, partial [Candidatus Nanopelagicales bacterium]
MRSRRTTELVLLVCAWALGILGTLQVGWATGEGTPPRLWITISAVALIALAMHVVVRVRAKYADPIMLPVGTLLTILGLIMIYRLDVADARRAELNNAPLPTPDVYSQLTWFAIAGILFCGVFVLLQDHRRLQRYTFTFGLIGLVLMVLPLAPLIGTTVNGATLWIRVG